MKLKFAAVVAALLASTAAMAANPASITVDATLAVSADDPTYSLFHQDSRLVDATQSFNDYYNFQLSTLSDVTFSVSANQLYNFQHTVLLKGVSFDSLKLSGPNDFQGTGTIDAGGATASFGFGNLVAGNYTITLLGHAGTHLGGSYVGDLSATPSVPEPESLALAFAGLSVIGMLARRRKAN